MYSVIPSVSRGILIVLSFLFCHFECNEKSGFYSYRSLQLEPSYTSKLPLILGALLAYRFISSFGALTVGVGALFKGGLVFGFRAAFASFARILAMPCGTGILQGAQPKD